MKTVLSPQDVAHVFAHQSQSEARNSNGSLFFSRQTIYSYGHHFSIAKFVENSKGQSTLLFTTRSYSKTTARHVRIVSSATSHINKIYCYSPDESPRSNIEQFEREIKNILSGIDKARKPEKYILLAEAIQSRAKIYADFFGLKIKEIDKLLKAANSGKYAENLAKERLAKEKREAKAKKESEKQFRESLAKWRAFEQGQIYTREFGRDFLRINKEKNRIETTQGIEIPMQIAKKAYQWIKETSKCTSCDFMVLDFKVTELTDDYIKIGCHTIYMDEINETAKVLGWLK